MISVVGMFQFFFILGFRIIFSEAPTSFRFFFIPRPIPTRNVCILRRVHLPNDHSVRHVARTECVDECLVRLYVL